MNLLWTRDAPIRVEQPYRRHREFRAYRWSIEAPRPRIGIPQPGGVPAELVREQRNQDSQTFVRFDVCDLAKGCYQSASKAERLKRGAEKRSIGILHRNIYELLDA